MGGRGDGVQLLVGEARVPAGHVGEHRQPGPRACGLDFGSGERAPDVGLELDGLLEALDPEFPHHLIVAGVDGKHWGIALRALEEFARHIVVVGHHQTHEPIDVSEVLEHGLGLIALAVPDPWQPSAGRDHLRADDEARDEAIQFLNQHRLGIKVNERSR